MSAQPFARFAHDIQRSDEFLAIHVQSLVFLNSASSTEAPIEACQGYLLRANAVGVAHTQQFSQFNYERIAPATHARGALGIGDHPKTGPFTSIFRI